MSRPLGQRPALRNFKSQGGPLNQSQNETYSKRRHVVGIVMPLQMRPLANSQLASAEDRPDKYGPDGPYWTLGRRNCSDISIYIYLCIYVV